MLTVVSLVLAGIALTLPLTKFVPGPTMSSHGLGAIKAIQTIHWAEVQYKSQFGRYANALSELGAPASGPATPSAADLINEDLSHGVKGGYKFTLTGNAAGYAITAVPVAFGSTGNRTFYSDQTMVIHQNFTPVPATASSSEMK
jgi:type IV pilus assembly protein PilA